MSDGIAIAVAGAAGKMGRAIVRVALETPGVRVAGASERAGSEGVGQDAAPGTKIVAAVEEAIAHAQVLIDFTAAAATVAHARACAARGVALVVGTTGLGEAQRAALDEAAQTIPVVVSANMSLGVNVLLGLLDTAARALGEAYDVEIVEAHHRLKRDAPSGTALRMAEVLAAALGRDLAADARHGRHGDVGARTPREIGIHAVRGGDVIGDHTAYFLGMGERIELTHKASSRDTFAHGAVRAATWLVGQPAGLYDMRDVLGISRRRR